MSLAASILLLALSRAEIVERMRAPVVTQCDGLIKVFANCPEDLRREYQTPIARFASDTAGILYWGHSLDRRRFKSPGIVIHMGGVRTNDTSVVTRVSTNGSDIVSRIYVRSPGHADLNRFRLEIIKAFFRSVKGLELGDSAALAAYRSADPRFRASDSREKLEQWLRGEGGHDDEEMITLMRKVIEPGKASRRDVLVYASRLFLYPDSFYWKFAGKFDKLSFKEAVEFAKIDPRIRTAALAKASEVVIFGGGRGDFLSAAASRYSEFLMELSKFEKSEEELLELLEKADAQLCVALEKAR